MLLARIVGTVVATRKDPRLVSHKLLLARPVDPDGRNEGNHLVAVDTVDQMQHFEHLGFHGGKLHPDKKCIPVRGDEELRHHRV